MPPACSCESKATAPNALAPSAKPKLELWVWRHPTPSPALLLPSQGIARQS